MFKPMNAAFICALDLPAPERIHAEGMIKPGWPLGDPQADERPTPREDDRDEPARS